MAKLYIGNTAYKVMLGNNSAHFVRGEYQNISNNTFISRTTGGGNLTIDATNGKVLKVEGNSKAWNQLVKNGNFAENSDWGMNGITVIIANNKATVTINSSISNKILTQSTCKAIKTHKVFIALDVVSSAPLRINPCFFDGTDSGFNYDVITTNTKNQIKGIVSITAKGAGGYLRLYFRNYNVDSTIEISNFRILDLTLLNYPNIATTTPTVAQVEKWLGNNVELKDYYPYNGGSILNVKMLGIKTTLPNTWTETKDFDVTRVWGKLNGEGSYVQIYPDGMRGVNDIKDVLYLNEDRAECKVGNVDLGSLSYTYNSSEQNFICSSLSDRHRGNEMMSSKYTKSSAQTIALINNMEFLGFYAESSFALKNTSYSDKDTFKAAMQGVPLIYQLATPLTYTNLMYDQSQANDGSDLIPLSVLTYRVDANGTEEIIRPTSVNGEPTSLAPTMDIKYINANIK